MGRGLIPLEQLGLVGNILGLRQCRWSEADVENTANDVGLDRRDVVNRTRVPKNEITRIGIDLYLVATFGLKPLDVFRLEHVEVVVLCLHISTASSLEGTKVLLEEGR